MKKIIVILTAILVLSSCSAPEIAETIAATSPTTAATTSPMSTAAETTAATTTAVTTKATVTTTTPTTTAPPQTTTKETTETLSREIYDIEFPDEFFNEEYGSPSDSVTEDLYDVQISAEAEKLYTDYVAFAKKQIADFEIAESDYGYENGRFLIVSGVRYYGLVDIDSDGTPEIFVYQTRYHQGYVNVEFYDLYGEDPYTELSDNIFFGFCRDGYSFFGKNKNGNLMFCSGYNHNYNEAYINIDEMIYDKTAKTEKLKIGDYFAAGFGYSPGLFHCDAYVINGEQVGNSFYHDPVPTADFEAAYNEFYDAIDFDVYWIYGDILYHGAEATEYKGKMAYEKYLEFTRKSDTVTIDGNSYQKDITELSLLRSSSEMPLTNDDIKDISEFTELRELNLAGNALTDISFLEKMPKLEILYLSRNLKLTDISPIANLKNLKTLFIDDLFDLKDLSSIAELQSLETIHMRNISADFSPLSSCKNLRELYIDKCEYTESGGVDLSFALKLDNLTVIECTDSWVSEEQAALLSEKFPNAKISINLITHK
jgi:hypothetical protein